MSRTQAHTRGIISGMITAISYGTNPLFAIPLLAAGIGVNSILFYRYFFAVLLYGLFLVCIKRRHLGLKLQEFATLLFLALLFSFSSISLFSSFQYIDGGISCTILFIYPSLVALISWLFYGEKLTRATVLAILLATGGVVMLSHGNAENATNLKGIGYVLISALLYALYIVGVRQFKSIRRMRGDKLNFYIMLFGLLVYVANLQLCTQLQLLHSPLMWGCAIMLAIIPTILSLETLTIAIKLIGSTKTAILGALEPLTAIIIGVTLFQEPLTWRVLVGFTLIISGVLLIVTQRAKRPLTPGPDPTPLPGQKRSIN